MLVTAGVGRSAIFRGTDRDFDLVDHPIPEAVPGGLVLRMELSGICGTDAHIYQVGAPEPMALGHEICGIVIDADESVTTDLTGRPIKTGDRVVPHPGARGGAYGFRSNPESGPPWFTGGFGQYLSLCYPDTALFQVNAPAEVAVLLEPLSVAMH